MKRATLQKIITWLVAHITTTEFLHTENVPKTGGCILAINHMSRLDIGIAFVNPVRPEVTALVTTKYLKYPLIKWFTITAEGIWLDRDTADFSAFRQAIEAIKAGKAVGIAPEGTRSTNHQLIEAKPGAVLLALKTNAPIVPMGITGSEDAAQKILSFRRPHMTVNFGKAFTLPPLERGGNREAALKGMTDEIMCRIAALLPEKYHGFYKNYPRVQELIAEG
jgi:1-acyl-sn-glycerol-3-phosphate acyltransferase